MVATNAVRVLRELGVAERLAEVSPPARICSNRERLQREMINPSMTMALSCRLVGMGSRTFNRLGVFEERQILAHSTGSQRDRAGTQLTGSD